MRNCGRTGDETGRVNALRRYQILDTPADSTFDAITSLAATLLKVPIALTSLVDAVPTTVPGENTGSTELVDTAAWAADLGIGE